MKIYVTGLGAVSAIGINVAENLRALRSGITGIGRSDELGIMLGEVKLSDEAIFRRFDLPEKDFSRTTLLGLIAAGEAWGESRNHEQVRSGLISGTSVGGLDRMERYYFQAHGDEPSDTHRFMIHDNGRTTEDLAREMGVSGYLGTVSTACSSGANAILQGARLIEGGILDRALVGGADPVTLFNAKGFSALMICDQELCRPFDDARKGLNLGEGAGFLVLENERSLSKTGRVPLCQLSGWHNASDAFHQTASSADGKGATLTMTRALAKAKLAAEEISYVNAHGTGTENNDLSESMALKNVFGDRTPPFSSTKSFTGHTLGAAGAIEAVYCVLSILSDALLPNLNFSTPMKETGLVPVTAFKPYANIRHVLTNSFGFGGNCTSLVFSKI